MEGTGTLQLERIQNNNVRIKERGRNGVAIMCDKTSANAIMGYHTVSDRILSVRFRGGQANTTIIQVYAPTSAALEEEHDHFYAELQDTIDNTAKGDILAFIRDFNAKVGQHKGGDGDSMGGRRKTCRILRG